MIIKTDFKERIFLNFVRGMKLCHLKKVEEQTNKGIDMR